MRAKLQKFTEFANKLLPHETTFLLANHQLEDEVKLKILEQVHYNCQNIHQFRPYDASIDKRKYSNLKNWIVKRLQEIDVDEHYKQIGRFEEKILLDQINQNEEKELLKTIRNYTYPTFYFIRFFELVRRYRHFLLIRMRYSDHKLVDNFLHQYQKKYERCLLVTEQLHEATQDIMMKYAQNTSESIQWERWLINIFYDEELDGLSRYMAMVRLAFISFQYQKADRLIKIMDDLDHWFSQGRFYSKRLLLNYYDNRLVMHTKLKEFERAIYYGYLSIREQNHDYLVYANNLNSVLIRTKRYGEALSIMNQATTAMKETRNFHSKIGYVSNYIRCLVRKSMIKNAQNYAESFLQAYQKEVLQYRWHRFFMAYLEVLWVKEDYRRIVDIIKKYDLTEREQKHQPRQDFFPLMELQRKIALYRLGFLDAIIIQQTWPCLFEKEDPIAASLPDYLVAQLELVAAD